MNSLIPSNTINRIRLSKQLKYLSIFFNADSSSNMIESSLKEFKLLSTEIDEQIKSMADSSYNDYVETL